MTKQTNKESKGMVLYYEDPNKDYGKGQTKVVIKFINVLEDNKNMKFSCQDVIPQGVTLCNDSGSPLYKVGEGTPYHDHYRYSVTAIPFSRMGKLESSLEDTDFSKEIKKAIVNISENVLCAGHDISYTKFVEYLFKYLASERREMDGVTELNVNDFERLFRNYVAPEIAITVAMAFKEIYETDTTEFNNMGIYWKISPANPEVTRRIYETEVKLQDTKAVLQNELFPASEFIELDKTFYITKAVYTNITSGNYKTQKNLQLKTFDGVDNLNNYHKVKLTVEVPNDKVEFNPHELYNILVNCGVNTATTETAIRTLLEKQNG